jgi:hypothetical protein
VKNVALIALATIGTFIGGYICLTAKLSIIPSLILISPVFGVTLGVIGILTDRFGIEALNKQTSLEGWKLTAVNVLLMLSLMLYVGTVIVIYMTNMRIVD